MKTRRLPVAHGLPMMITMMAALCCAHRSAAQSAVFIEIDKPVLRAGESAIVTLLAAYPSDLFAMYRVGVDFVTTVGPVGWSDFELIPRMDFIGTTPGAASPSGVDGIVAAQFHFPLQPEFTDRSNPIAFWRATYTAPGMTPEPFDVEIRTETSEFWVYVTIDSTAFESHLAGLVEGSSVIRVIGCYADCDGSGELDLFDFLCFQNMFAMGDLYADCDESGALDLFDFLCFQNEFAAGCP